MVYLSAIRFKSLYEYIKNIIEQNREKYPIYSKFPFEPLYIKAVII